MHPTAIDYEGRSCKNEKGGGRLRTPLRLIIGKRSYFFTGCFSSDDSAVACIASGTLMLVPQLRQRTVLPRAVVGTESTRRHVKVGHMILMLPDDIDAIPQEFAAHRGLRINTTAIQREPLRSATWPPRFRLESSEHAIPAVF